MKTATATVEMSATAAGYGTFKLNGQDVSSLVMESAIGVRPGSGSRITLQVLPIAGMEFTAVAGELFVKGWLPTSIVPDDGSKVLAYWIEDAHFEVAQVHNRQWYAAANSWGRYEILPDFWTTLPDAPKDKEKKDQR